MHDPPALHVLAGRATDHCWLARSALRTVTPLGCLQTCMWNLWLNQPKMCFLFDSWAKRLKSCTVSFFFFCFFYHMMQALLPSEKFGCMNFTTCHHHHHQNSFLSYVRGRCGISFIFAVCHSLVQVQIATLSKLFHPVTWRTVDSWHYFRCHCFWKCAISIISSFYFLFHAMV